MSIITTSSHDQLITNLTPSQQDDQPPTVFKQLPIELVHIILDQLPLKSQCALMCTSKFFNKLVFVYQKDQLAPKLIAIIKKLYPSIALEEKSTQELKSIEDEIQKSSKIVTSYKRIIETLSSFPIPKINLIK